jgi:hypothetical protein
LSSILPPCGKFALAECYPALYKTLFGDAAPAAPGLPEK